MKQRSKEPFVPVEMHHTVRREVLSALSEGPRSAKEMSGKIGLREREVYEHLEHIRKTIGASGSRLVVTPAECKKCGFVFSKRSRLKKPGKCPVCRGEAISEPLFTIEEARSSAPGEATKRGAVSGT